MDSLEYSEQMRDSLVNFLSRLIKTPSLSGHEENVVVLIRDEMEKLGFDEVFVDNFGNVIGRIGSGKTRIAIDGHIDTVDIGDEKQWQRDPFSGEFDDEWVYGRGAADQKAGVACAVYAGRVIKDLDLIDDFTLYVVGSALEENCDGLCWQYIIKEGGIRPDYVLITEPTNLALARGQRGRLEFKINVKGVSAHASAPERGVNAIYDMAKIALEIEKLNEKLPRDEFLGKGSIAITQISSRSPSLNAVPDFCSAHVDRRLTNGEDKETVLQQMNNLLHELPVDAHIEVCTFSDPTHTGLVYPAEKYFPSWVMPEDHVLLRAAKECFERLFNEEAEIGKWVFSTNGVATCGLFSIPTVGFGPGEERFAHAPNERVRIDHLVKATAFYSVFPQILVKSLKNERRD